CVKRGPTFSPVYPGEDARLRSAHIRDTSDSLPAMSSNSEAVGSTSGPIASVGASFLGIAETAGGMALLFGRILKRLARFSCDGPELWRNLHRMGVKSLPIVVVTALFAGAIMVIQSSPIVERYGAQQ